MASPFPGMDPYIEAPEIWSDFHGRLAEEISAGLNEVLQPHYVDVWPVQLWDPLPTLPVPLREPDPDVPLKLGAVVAAVYQRGAYSRLIDDRLTPPPPPLSDVEAAWLAERLH